MARAAARSVRSSLKSMLESNTSTRAVIGGRSGPHRAASCGEPPQLTREPDQIRVPWSLSFLPVTPHGESCFGRYDTGLSVIQRILSSLCARFSKTKLFKRVSAKSFSCATRPEFAATGDGGHDDLSHRRGLRYLGPIADQRHRNAPKYTAWS